MSTPKFKPADKAPLPPKNADVITTACDYCIVACGYKVFRWPTGTPDGGPKKNQNALGRDYTLGPLQGGWVGPNQYTQAVYNGKLHNIVVVADPDAKVVNVGGDHSIRGGCIAQKVYNSKGQTADRLKTPLLRVNGVLTPVSWDLALDVMAGVSKHVIETHGESAWALKFFSYQFYENTYALTKLAFKSIGTPAVAEHDHPSIVDSVPGWTDIGYDIFGGAYEDFALADTILISGTDPFETKTVVWNEWILKGIQKNKTKVIMVNPRRTAGAAFVEKNGGLYIDVNPGSDTPVHLAIQRVILENGWEDKEFIAKMVNNFWETDSGFGQGTRNTPWQWRTTWGNFQVKSYDDWKKWLLEQEESKPEVAAKIAGIDPAKILMAAEMMAKPKANGQRVKTTIAIEKGNYWSNNYLNTVSIGTLGVILGVGGRPGSVMTRLGGHQRGGAAGGPYPDMKSPYKHPGRRRDRLDLDRWVESGNVRFAYVVGTTWIQAMAGSTALEDAFKRQTKLNPNQVRNTDKQSIIDTLIKRTDSGGMVMVNQDIYMVDPIGSQYADIILPASGWGEHDFTRSNGERRIRLYSKFYDAPGDAKPDWMIVSMFAKKMGFEGYDWKESNDVFEESCRFSRGGREDYNAIKVVAKAKGVKAHDLLRSYGTTGLQCPLLLDDGKIVETKRLHDYNRHLTLPATGPEGPTILNKRLTSFGSQTGKLNMLKAPWGFWKDFYEYMSPKDGELWISNGRINEVWQSGFDDLQRRAYIQQRWPVNFIEINPDDAKTRGVESGDMVSIESTRVPVQKDFNLGVKGDDMSFTGLTKRGHIKTVTGQFTAVALVTPSVKKGVAFTYFLRKDSPANNITPRVPDPVTQNYRFKIASGTIKKLGESPYKSTFAEMTFKRRDIG
ncbi:MAG: arsenite oxidase large subunit [Rhodospirillales bacterium RIFCSPLOWO2_12_FULL_58_28]|nr:MAG: arsenite oxidase large subunit [Rhodospirillales bacterium RIFCSPLOWO2_02_FULL_58_16]OHC76878.1 MAG: arsenite oxidase large subunit [Rhodospirillales bacterium RIFCSPLOWO2_12_FULL_58_28]